jgi:YfiH family protein
VNTDGLQPLWPAPPGVRAFCSTRQGGVSTGSYASLNLGDHVGDDPHAVLENRVRLQRALGVRPVFLQQVHGIEVALLDAETADGTVADACISAQRGVACTIMLADCLPLLFTTLCGEVVGAAHAGWRGLAAGVIESTVQQMIRATATPVSDILVWLGPCIGSGAFEVGPEVRAAFVEQDAGSAPCFAPQVNGKFLADLAALARRRLDAMGVTRVYGNDGSVAWCTVSNPSRFFSHRRDRVSGRMAAGIWRE